MLSDSGKAILRAASDAFDEGSGKKLGIEYDLDFHDKITGDVVSTIRFKLKEPISGVQAEESLSKLFPKLATILEEDLAAKIGDALVRNMGIKEGVAKLSRDTESKFDVEVVDDIAEEVPSAAGTAARTSGGRFTSTQNLKAALELLMKENMLSTMTSPSAGTGRDTPLRNRTGRFIKSSSVASVIVPDNDAKPMSIYYKYMVYPYQVFDPVHTQSPQKGLASRMRNPQKIIGDALVSAARKLLGTRYKLKIRQVY